MKEKLNPIQIKNLRKMIGEKRLNILDKLYEFSRNLISSSIKENSPNMSWSELQEKTNRRMISLTNPERPWVLPKHFADAVGVIAVQGEKLDLFYLEKWAKKKSVWQTLQKAKNWAKKIET